MFKFGTVIAAATLLTVGAWMHTGNAAQINNPELNTQVVQADVSQPTDAAAIGIDSSTTADADCCPDDCCEDYCFIDCVHGCCVSLHDAAFSWLMGG